MDVSTAFEYVVTAAADQRDRRYVQAGRICVHRDAAPMPNQTGQLIHSLK